MFKNEKPFEIIVLGPPVSGKGTQAHLLSKTFDVPHISTGTILHNIKADKNHPMAEEVSGYMNAGKLVPTELVNRLVADRIKQEDCKFGYVIDGYPRTLEQAQFIEKNADPDYVFLINVSDAAIVERTSGRRVCKNGHTYHLKYSPSKKEGVCDVCGEPLFLRDDDREETVNNRLAIFHKESKPIVEYYRGEGVLIEINGELHIEEVYRSMVRLMINNLRKQIEHK